MNYKVLCGLALLSFAACQPALEQPIADCQCQKFEAAAKALDADPNASDKVLAYMGEILDCITPHFDKLEAMSEDERHQLQQKIDALVQKQCGAAHAKLKNR